MDILKERAGEFKEKYWKEYRDRTGFSEKPMKIVN